MPPAIAVWAIAATLLAVLLAVVTGGKRTAVRIIDLNSIIVVIAASVAEQHPTCPTPKQQVLDLWLWSSAWA